MSDTDDTADADADATDDPRSQLADAFDADTDPLQAHADTFEGADADPFAPFLTEVLGSRDVVEKTVADYERLIRQWRAHMAREGRHPACPNRDHVERFARYERDEKGNHPLTITEKLRKLAEIYRYWQDDPVYPHPTDYNPVQLARSTLDLSYPERKEPPRLSIADLRDVLQTISHTRDYAIVLCQLKLGLRATEVCNLRLDELALTDPELTQAYPQLGSHVLLDDRPDAVYIPHDRSGNKSRRPRVLPIDTELQHVLETYLRLRPTVDEPWVFLSKNRRRQLTKQAINECWTTAFHPEYAESDQYRAVTSHYGRHWFTTYWRVQQDLNRELLKYLRGDTPGSAEIGDRGAVDEYIHTYYEDIEARYREEMVVFAPP